jgi:uncharacterized protein
LYLNGRGRSRDHAQAHRYYLQTAEQGHAPAMNLVGRCREHGWGCSADAAQAWHGYERSAHGGYFRGQYNWGTVLLDQGRTAEVAQWLEKAARSGTAKVRVAVMNVIAGHTHCEALLDLRRSLSREADAKQL